MQKTVDALLLIREQYVAGIKVASNSLFFLPLPHFGSFRLRFFSGDALRTVTTCLPMNDNVQYRPTYT